MKREVVIKNAHPRLRLDRRVVATAIALLDEQFSGSPLERGGAKRRGVSAVPPGELSVVFLTDPALAKIHAGFMADPSATDVITFAGDAVAGLAGEICVSADMAAKHAGLVEGRSHDRPRPAGRPALQKAFSAELTLYLVHGWLHLAGYDDLQPAKKRRMRAAEKRAMTLLRMEKALPVFRLR